MRIQSKERDKMMGTEKGLKNAQERYTLSIELSNDGLLIEIK